MMQLLTIFAWLHHAVHLLSCSSSFWHTAHISSPVLTGQLVCFGSPHEVLGNPADSADPTLSTQRHAAPCCAMLRHAAPLVVTKGGSVSESLRQIWHWQHNSNTRASF